MNEDEKRKAILDRLVKLQALADSNSNSFQNEVSAASAKIAEIMDKYAISWAELQAAKSEQDVQAVNESFSDFTAENKYKNLKAWHWKLANVVASATNTKVFVGWHNNPTFYGLESSGSFASQLFIEFLGLLDRASLKAQHDFVKQNGRGSEESRYFRSSWLAGCLRQMDDNVYQEKQKSRQEHSTALVLFETRIEAAYKIRSEGFTTGKHTWGSRGHSESGYESGKAYGAGLRIGSKKIGANRLLTG